VIEALRQVCLRDVDDQTTVNTHWSKYMAVFANECVDTDLSENPNCHEKAFRAANIPQGIIDRVNFCMRMTFRSHGNEDLTTIYRENFKLKAELEVQNEDHVNHFPALYVNKEIYTGSFQNRRKLTEFICSHFATKEDTPSICSSAGGSLEHTSKDYAVYAGILVGSVLVMAIVLYCVRRSVKREVMWRMSNELPQIVTQYHAFKDKSDSTNVGDDNENDNDDEVGVASPIKASN